jgi:hypothetical protein
MRVAENWVCPSCLRIRTPWHWLLRRLGHCFDWYG